MRLAIYNPGLGQRRCAGNYKDPERGGKISHKRGESGWNLSQHKCPLVSPTDIYCALFPSSAIPLLLSQWGLHFKSSDEHMIASEKKLMRRVINMAAHVLDACVCAPQCARVGPYAHECELGSRGITEDSECERIEK